MPQSTLAWVKATILGASLTGTIACGGAQSPQDDAPTCGPCCHGGGPECEQTQQLETVGGEEHIDPDAEAERELENQQIMNAPTCGPCCHGSDDPECD